MVSTVEELYRFVANANDILDAKIDSETKVEEAPAQARATDVSFWPCSMASIASFRFLRYSNESVFQMQCDRM